jgi:hypothetical protein
MIHVAMTLSHASNHHTNVFTIQWSPRMGSITLLGKI